MPLPGPGRALLRPPDRAEVALICRAVQTGAAPPGGLNEIQTLLVRALVPAMTEHPAVLDGAPLGPEGLAEGLAHRNEAFRVRILQVMLLVALVLRPLPPEVAGAVRRYAVALSVDESMVTVAEEFAAGNLGLAAFDFQRNGYTADWDTASAAALHTSDELAGAWDEVVADAALARRWEALEELAPGTLGRRVADFYRARGFAYPGRPGSAPPLLAQHDWVHVVADYGTTVESELEVFGLIARANDDPRGFSLLAMVLSLFETGYLRSGAGLFEASVGHLSGDAPAMTVRLADAMRRGARCDGSVDFLRVDWFALADRPVEEVREHFGMVPKDPAAAAAGSVGPFEAGGISPFQFRAGRERAAAAGVAYEAFGAVPGR